VTLKVSRASMKRRLFSFSARWTSVCGVLSGTLEELLVCDCCSRQFSDYFCADDLLIWKRCVRATLRWGFSYLTWVYGQVNCRVVTDIKCGAINLGCVILGSPCVYTLSYKCQHPWTIIQNRLRCNPLLPLMRLLRLTVNKVSHSVLLEGTWVFYVCFKVQYDDFMCNKNVKWF